MEVEGTAVNAKRIEMVFGLDNKHRVRKSD